MPLTVADLIANDYFVFFYANILSLNIFVLTLQAKL